MTAARRTKRVRMMVTVTAIEADNPAQALGLAGCLSLRNFVGVKDAFEREVADQLRRGLPVRRIAASLPRVALGGIAEQDGLRPVCRNGCSACCHQDLAISPIEILDIAAYVRATRTSAELQALRASLDEPRTKHSPCPLLGATGSCTVYAHRPLTCVSTHSFDAIACKDLDGRHPFHGPQTQMTLAAQLGLCSASERAGLPGAPMDLVGGLRRALDDPTAEERWRRGEDVFAGCDRVSEEVWARVKHHLPVLQPNGDVGFHMQGPAAQPRIEAPRETSSVPEARSAGRPTTRRQV